MAQAVSRRILSATRFLSCHGSGSQSPDSLRDLISVLPWLRRSVAGFSPRPDFCPAMAQAVSRRILTADAQARLGVTFRGICGEQNGSVTGFPRSTSVPPHPVSIILPMLHPGSLICHRRCITLAICSVIK